RNLRLQRRVNLPSRLRHLPAPSYPIRSGLLPTIPLVPKSGATSDCAVDGDETREPAHNPAHDCGPSAARWGRHQHDPRLARSCVFGHDACLRRGRHGNEGEGAGPSRYLEPANQAIAASVAVADDVPEKPVIPRPTLEVMLRLM